MYKIWLDVLYRLTYILITPPTGKMDQMVDSDLKLLYRGISTIQILKQKLRFEVLNL